MEDRALTCDVLLINPPWISKNENIWHGVKSAMPPLGLLQIASYVESKGFDVHVLDVHVEQLTERQVYDYLKARQPRVVGLSVLTATANTSHQIAKIVKDASPESIVVFGGVHPEAVPVETLCNSAVDVVVRGDGEEPFLEICKAEKPVHEISGTSYRQDNTIVHNPTEGVEDDIDKYPMPAYHLVPMDKYYPAIGAYKRLPAINMLMTRGCPGKCTFCNSAMTKLRTRDAAHVVKEIKYLKEKYGIREIQFYDDTFTVMKKNVMKFCELMVKEDLDLTWACFVRADCFSEPMAVAMKAAGCHQILIGIESGDDEILRLLRKPIDREKNSEVIKIARKHGIDVRAAFIFGNRGETLETMQRTLDYSIDLDPDISMYNICTPYPGTQLFEWAKENSYLTSEEWSDYELSIFMMNLPTLETTDLYAFYKHAYKRYYLRPVAVWRRLTRITKPSQIIDLFHAFMFIILRRKVGKRGRVHTDWIGHNKEEFFDLHAGVETKAILTYQARMADVFPEEGVQLLPVAAHNT